MTQEYFHLTHVPEYIMNTLIDLKVKIDMGDLPEDALREHKIAFNKLAELTPVKLYKL